MVTYIIRAVEIQLRSKTKDILSYKLLVRRVYESLFFFSQAWLGEFNTLKIYVTIKDRIT